MGWTRRGAANPWLLVAQTAVLVVVGTVVYFVLPVPSRMRTGSWVLLFCVGMAVLAVLIVLAIRRLIREGTDIRLRGLVLLLCLSVLFFSYAYAILAAEPGQFADMHTRTDALYFTVSTLATVGFGDVHAAGQTARAAVTFQIVFDLVFLGATVGTISTRMRTRASERMGHHQAGPADDGSTPAS
jgi:hypothetical protein